MKNFGVRNDEVRKKREEGRKEEKKEKERESLRLGVGFGAARLHRLTLV